MEQFGGGLGRFGGSLEVVWEQFRGSLGVETPDCFPDVFRIFSGSVRFSVYLASRLY